MPHPAYKLKYIITKGVTKFLFMRVIRICRFAVDGIFINFSSYLKMI